MWLMLALLLPADAAEVVRCLGWTADGDFVWEEVDKRSWAASDTGSAREAGSVTARFGVVHTASGEVRRFLIRKETTGSGSLDEPVVGDVKAWFAWTQAHPMTGGASRQLGTRQVELTPKGEVSGAHGWTGFTYAVPKEHQTYAISLRRGEDRADFGILDTLVGNYVTSATVTPWPSPDGTAVAILQRFAAAETALGPAPALDMVSVYGVSPVVEVLASSDLAAAVVEATAASLGGLPVRVGSAQKAREKTVVYAAEGFEAQAQAIAAKVPGGAVVEPLTWKPIGDLVIALGASAAPSP